MSKKKHQRDFLELEKAIKGRLKYVPSLGFSEDETKIRKEELEIILKKISKLRFYRLKPLQKASTVHGLTFDIGDKFFIPGNLETKYKIVAFPDSCTIRGECSNPNIGEPYTCEVYIEDARKVKKKKSKKTKTKRLKKKK